MTGDGTVACSFCAEQVPSDALVCRSCARDIAIPEHLRAEHAELTEKRDQLKGELERVRTDIASRAKRLGKL